MMNRVLLLVVLGCPAALIAETAAETAGAPTTAPTPAPAIAVDPPARPLRLGMTLAEEPGLDRSVVVVRSVEGASTAAALGLQPGDHLLTLAGQPVTGLPSIAEITRSLRAGAIVTASIERAGSRQELSATAIETPRPAQLAERTRELDAAVTALAANAAQARELRLEEILVLLKQVQEELPKAAAAFKQQYPQGRFHIAISIDIQSDSTAVEPKPVE